VNCLLDTCSLIWALTDSEKLSPAATEVLTDPGTIRSVSSVSFLEMSIKASVGKLQISGLPLNALPEILYEKGFDILVLDPFLCLNVSKLPLDPDHRDPFDRLLVWQAIERNLTLISSDQKVARYRKYGLSLIW